MIKQSKLIKAAYFSITILAVICVVWLMAGTVTGYFRASYKTFTPSVNGLTVSVIVSMIAAVLLWYIGKWFAGRFTGWFVAFISIMAIPKLILVFAFKLNPISDMYSYNALGGSAANQDSWAWMYHVGVLDLDSIFPHVLHIANLYNVLFRISINSPKVVQVFNIACSVLTTFLILAIVTYFFNRTIGMFAALTFFFLPTWYLYTTLIGAEPAWLLALFLSMYFLIKLLAYRSLKDWHPWVTIGLIIVLLFFAQSIRPLSMVFVIGYVCFVWFRLSEQTTKENRADFWVPRIGILAVMLGFFALNQLQPRIDRFYFGVPIADAKIGEQYTLATGTNPKTGGVYNYNMILKLEKYNHNQKLTNEQRFAGFEKVLSKQLKANVAGIKAHGTWKHFFYDKNETLMKPDYGPVLFYSNTRKKTDQFQVMPRHMINGLTNLVTGNQVVMLLLVIIGLLAQFVAYRIDSKVNRERNGVLLSDTIMIGLTIIFLLVEVQSRYQIAFYVPRTILSGLGMGHLMPTFQVKNDSGSKNDQHERS